MTPPGPPQDSASSPTDPASPPPMATDAPRPRRGAVPRAAGRAAARGIGSFLRWYVGQTDSPGRATRAPASDGPRVYPLPPLPPVRPLQPLLNDGERTFFGVLEAVVGKRGRVLTKVSLSSVVRLTGTDRDTPGRAEWHRRTLRHTLDYLILDVVTLRPRLAVQLEPPGHVRPKRRARDAELVRLLSAAGLPLLRQPAASGYDVRRLQGRVLPYLSGY